MDVPPIIRAALGPKVWDFAYGSLLIGASPLATTFGLAYFLSLPCNLIFRHYGERTVMSYQFVSTALALLMAFPAFGLAIWWRTRHRVLPKSFLPLEIIVAVVWGLFFFAFLGVLTGPNDDWNRR
jgi:hypothetical protein